MNYMILTKDAVRVARDIRIHRIDNCIDDLKARLKNLYTTRSELANCKTMDDLYNL